MRPELDLCDQRWPGDVPTREGPIGDGAPSGAPATTSAPARIGASSRLGVGSARGCLRGADELVSATWRRSALSVFAGKKSRAGKKSGGGGGGSGTSSGGGG